MTYDDTAARAEAERRWPDAGERNNPLADVGFPEFVAGARWQAERDARAMQGLVRDLEALTRQESTRQVGGDVSCGGYEITADGCHAGALANQILDVLAKHSLAAKEAEREPTEAQVEAAARAMWDVLPAAYASWEGAFERDRQWHRTAARAALLAAKEADHG